LFFFIKPIVDILFDELGPAAKNKSITPTPCLTEFQNIG